MRFAVLVLVLVSTWSRGAGAQDCGCDHTVPPEILSIDGDELGAAPGDVICITSGQREFLTIRGMEGSAQEPIVIKNCGGQVLIENSERGYGLTLATSSHVRITGTGDEDLLYGFSVSASREGPDYSASCIIASEKSTDYEIDHIEAYECGFAGVSAKTDPTCDERDLSGFVQRNTQLHHLYLHDTGGEGIYFGSTGFPSRAGTCDGAMVDLFPHSHEGVYIHDNIIEDTGWDGAQIGVSPKDCYFYRNRIARVGLRMEEYQMQGLQIGGGSACEVTGNFFEEGPAAGIFALDAADTLLSNNVIVGFLDGIYVNDRDSEVSAGKRVRVAHNTVVESGDRGITLFGSRTFGNLVYNNLIVQGGMSPLGIGGEVDATEDGNVILDNVAAALFTDVASDDYSLAEGSPAIDQGVALAALGVDVDQLGAARDALPDAGAFEFGADAPDEPEAPPGPGDNPSGAGDGDADESSGKKAEASGCQCQSGPRPGSARSWLHLLFSCALATIWLRRRSHS